ncbi:MAG: hypothetical protein ACTSW4_04085 [Candidatus Ranarchaeia archaeon]
MERSWMEGLAYALGGVSLVFALIVLVYSAIDYIPCEEETIPWEIIRPAGILSLILGLLGPSTIVLTAIQFFTSIWPF